MSRSLRALAAETDHLLLWVIEATTIIAMVALTVLLTQVQDWRPFLATGMMLAYFTMAAVTGAYLILIKNKPREDR